MVWSIRDRIIFAKMNLDIWWKGLLKGVSNNFFVSVILWLRMKISFDTKMNVLELHKKCTQLEHIDIDDIDW